MSNNNKNKLKNNKKDIKNLNKNKLNIPQHIKNQFSSNSVRINDMEYIESFFRNNNTKLIKEYQKLNKNDKKGYQKLVEENSNPFKKKEIEQIEDDKYQKLLLSKNNYDDYEDEIYYYPKKRNVVQIDDEVYNRLLTGKYYLDEIEIMNSEKESLIKNPKVSDQKTQRILIRDKSPNGNVKIKRILTPIKKENNFKSNSQEKKKEIKKVNKRYVSKCTYYIKEGNNGGLVEKCLLTRKNWNPVSKQLMSYANLIWTPLANDLNFENRNQFTQFYNHFEFHYEISNKMRLFTNLLHFCEFYKIDLFSFYPVTIIFLVDNDNFEEQLENFKKLYIDVPNLIDKKENTYNEYFQVPSKSNIGKTQKIYIPKTFYNGKNIWLLKPFNLNCGRDIQVFSSLNDIVTEIQSIKKNNNKIKRFLIQKYLESPILYKQRKFDIRIWILFICEKDLIKCYMFKEGHLKASSINYNLNSNDIYIHLTNYTIQKYNPNFAKIEEGNEIPFEDFQKELNKNKDKIDFKKTILPKIINIISMIASTVKSKLNLRNRENSFEIFGCDFIIDSNYQPYLLEVNTNPGLEESSQLIKMLIPRMIDDAFRLTIDKNYPRNRKDEIYNNKSPYPVKGYSDDENMWQKIKFK